MTIQFNPVAVRESRAMWRGARSFLLLLCYAGALSLVAFLAYNSEVQSAYRWAEYEGAEMQVQSARVGHTLFIALSVMQLLAWALIGPALSATSVSSERERGLLESLLMSNLRPRQIIAGKFSVSASFIGILIVATLPVLAICFMLGGVSPLEFGGAFGIQVATAFLTLSLGIYCSTVLKLSTHALGAAFSLLVGWVGATVLALCASDWLRYSMHVPKFIARDFLQLFGLSNPGVGFMLLVEPMNSSDTFQPFGMNANTLWPVCIAAQVLAGCVFLHLAGRHLSRPLSREEAPAQPRRRKRRSKGEPAGEAVALLEGEPDFGAREASHFEVPILKHIAFGGPLMRHYLRAAWRWKMPRGRTRTLWLAAASIILAAHAFIVWQLLDYEANGAGLLGMIFVFVSLSIPVYVAASAGLSIARDRELGSWNHLRLADLKPSEIARAKMLAPIVTGLSYASWLLPLALFSWLVLLKYEARGEYNYNNSREGARIVLLALPFWLLGMVQLSGWASICSLRAKRSSIALVASFAGALIFLVGLPLVFEISSGSSNYASQQGMRHFLGLFHPFYALFIVGDLLRDGSYHPEWCRPDLYVLALITHSVLAFAFFRKVAGEVAGREK